MAKKYTGIDRLTQIFQLIKSKFDALATVAKTGSYNDLSDKPTIPSGGVTGVKGNFEGTYRTGNVNLTPDNIGALPKSNPRVSGTLSFGNDGHININTFPSDSENWDTFISNSGISDEEYGLNISQWYDECSGIHMNSDTIVMWSPCDSGALWYFDDDNGDIIFHIDKDGKYYDKNNTSYLPLTGGTLTGLLHINLNGNDLTIGSQNSGYCHIYSSQNIPFIFNNRILTTRGGLGNADYPFSDLHLNGSIHYKGTKAEYPMIKFKDNTADAYGNGIVIGGGGLVVIGSGESSDTIAAQYSSGGDEQLHLGSDGSITFSSNVQSGYSSGKHMTLDTNGDLSIPRHLAVKETNSILLRPTNSSYTAGIGYDTNGNECIGLWAKNSVTRLRWHAGVDMTSMTSGTMMSRTPDFEISKADGTAKGYIGGNQIMTSWTHRETFSTSSSQVTKYYSKNVNEVLLVITYSSIPTQTYVYPIDAITNRVNGKQIQFGEQGAGTIGISGSNFYVQLFSGGYQCSVYTR